jgi:cytoskeletal protein CcmA (bactofilin family)
LTRGSAERQEVREAATTTVVARETRLEGQVSGNRAVRVEGSLKGSVHLEAPLEVVAGAVVEADVRATVVRVAGTVTGNITADELVELMASAVVKGDISTPSLHVVEGARLEGRVEMRSQQASGPVAK